MNTRWKALRIAGEITGVAFAGAVVFVMVVLAMWVPQTVLVLAPAWLVAGVAAAYVFRRSNRWRMTPRLLFDFMLLSFVPAACLTAWSIQARWPIRGRRVDAHGWGATGGEGNILWIAPLHVALFVLLVLICRRTRKRP